MEVKWTHRHLERYAAEATLLAERLQKVGDPWLLDIALNVLRTYCAIPTTDRLSHAADYALTKLACIVYTPIQQRGDWFEILRLWPQLRRIAGQLSERECEVTLTVQCAIVLNALGRHTEADALYATLLVAPDFAQFPHGWQAEILHQASVCYLDQGKYREAQLLLDRGLDVTSSYQSIAYSSPETRYELEQTHIAPLWKERTYIMNLLGNLALLGGDFHQARACHEECLAICREYDWENNFSCIAYQSLGRLLLHQRQFAAALPVLKKNHEICEQRSVREGVIDSCIYLAAAKIGLGAFREAEELLQHAYIDSKALQRSTGIALCHFYWGKLAQKEGRHQAAIIEWHRTLHILSSSRSPLLELPTLVALCHSLLLTGRVCQLLAVASQLIHHLAKRRIGIRRSALLVRQYW